MDISTNTNAFSDEDSQSNSIDLRLALANINIFNVEIRDFRDYVGREDGNLVDDNWLIEKVSYEFLLRHRGGQRWVKNVAFYLEDPSDLTLHDFKERLLMDIEYLRSSYRDVENGKFDRISPIDQSEA